MHSTMYGKVLMCATFLDQCYKIESIFEVHVGRFQVLSDEKQHTKYDLYMNLVV